MEGHRGWLNSFLVAEEEEGEKVGEGKSRGDGQDVVDETRKL